MNIILLLLTFFLTTPALAEIFKCVSEDNKTIYQSTACRGSSLNENVVKIKDVPANILEEAQIEYKAWQEQHAAEKLADAKAAEEKQKLEQQQAIVNALTRSARAQEQQAIAETARAITQQQTQYQSGYYYPYPYYNVPVPVNVVPLSRTREVNPSGATFSTTDSPSSFSTPVSGKKQTGFTSSTTVGR
jgi:hypothetical protein